MDPPRTVQARAAAAAAARAQEAARRVHGGKRREPEQPTYIGLVTRLIAFALDAAIINAIAFLVGATVALALSILPQSSDRNKVLVAIGGVAFVLWAAGYFLAFWTATGETPGNRTMKIRVQRTDGTRLRPRHALVRLVGIVLAAPLLVGFLPILVTPRRRGLQDWMAGTVVVGVPEGAASGEGDHSGDARPAARLGGDLHGSANGADPVADVGQTGAAGSDGGIEA